MTKLPSILPHLLVYLIKRQIVFIRNLKRADFLLEKIKYEKKKKKNYYK